MLELVDPNEVEDVVCEKVSNEEAADIVTNIIPEMVKILKGVNGLGLAAPQIGIKKKFSVYFMPGEDEQHIIFNAFYVKDGDGRIKGQEGCLSYGLKNFTEVKRFKNIKLIYDEFNLDTNKLEKRSRKIKGVESIIVQHEVDHTGGLSKKSITIYTKK